MNKLLFKPNRSQLSKHLAKYIIAEKQSHNQKYSHRLSVHVHDGRKTDTRPKVLTPIIGPRTWWQKNRHTTKSTHTDYRSTYMMAEKQSHNQKYSHRLSVHVHDGRKTGTRPKVLTPIIGPRTWWQKNRHTTKSTHTDYRSTYMIAEKQAHDQKYSHRLSAHSVLLQQCHIQLKNRDALSK